MNDYGFIVYLANDDVFTDDDLLAILVVGAKDTRHAWDLAYELVCLHPQMADYVGYVPASCEANNEADYVESFTDQHIEWINYDFYF